MVAMRGDFRDHCATERVTSKRILAKLLRDVLFNKIS